MMTKRPPHAGAGAVAVLLLALAGTGCADRVSLEGTCLEGDGGH
ncbi:hypothetical protein ACFXJ5_26270 [Streptomyces sp. NPDC059373]